METKNEALELAQIIDNDGKGCKCRAYSSSECACGAIWTEPSMKRISAMLLAQAAEIEKLRESYQSACLLVADMHEAAWKASRKLAPEDAEKACTGEKWSFKEKFETRYSTAFNNGCHGCMLAIRGMK